MTREQFSPEEDAEAHRRLVRRIRREQLAAEPEPEHTPQCDEYQIWAFGSTNPVSARQDWCCEWHEIHLQTTHNKSREGY